MAAHIGFIVLAALAHARAGRPVFPCKPDKSPYVRAWRRAATTDADQIQAWWAQWPSALIGMPTGAATGVWVLDMDVHGGAPGEDSLFDLTQAHGELPDTVEAITGSGGRHIYFRWDPARPVRNSAGRLGEGLDVRGEGGYVIVPPSQLPDGRAYEWEGSSNPDEGVRAAPAPHWLMDLVAPVRKEMPSSPGADRPAGVVSRPEMASALEALDPDCGYDDWLTVAMALQSTGQDWAFEVWDDWSAKGAKYPGTDKLRDKWDSFSAAGNASGAVGIGSLFALAKARGWERRVRRVEGPIPPEPPDPPDEDAAPEASDQDPRPLILIEPGNLPEIVDEAERALLSAQTPIYVHGNRLVRIGTLREPLVALHPAPGGAMLFDLQRAWLVEELTRVARWRRWDKRSQSFRPVNCPREVADTLLAREGGWRFPPLSGFLESPSLTLDGRVISALGYDAPTGLFLASPLRMQAIEKTSPTMGQEAADRLAELISTFPFVDDSHRGAAIAMMMTAILRRVLPTAPFGAISSSTPATGKSLLADVISVVATGRRGAAMALGNDHAELEKRIDAALLDGDALVIIDNVDRAVRSDVLCQIATQTSKTVRVLGYSRKVETPTNICWLMTGNNLTVLGDLTRRIVMIRLESDTENPEERHFARDAVEYAREMRAQAVRDCLSISRGYLQAGAPAIESLSPYGSFETWDRMVRRPIVWAGFPDPLTGTRDLKDEDHEFVAIRAFMSECIRLFGTEPRTAAQILEKAFDTYDIHGRIERVNSDLADAIEILVGPRSKATAAALGYRLRSWQGRIVDGMRIAKHHKERNRTVHWVVQSV